MPGRSLRLQTLLLPVSFAAVHALAGPAADPVASTPPPVSAGGDIGPHIISVVADGRITDASGLAANGDGSLLFMHQDAGRSSDVHGLDQKGQVRLTISLPVRSNEDWEDIATAKLANGQRVLFVGDIGDAFFARRNAGLGGRKEFRLIRFTEPAAGTTGTVRPTGMRTYRLAYSDGMVGRNAETLLVQPGTGQVFVVNKTEERGLKTTLWQAPSQLDPARVNVLKPAVASLPVFRATGGSFSPNGDRLVIRNDDTAYVWWIKDGNVARSLEADPVEVALPRQRQGEGVTFTADGHALLVNSEGPRQPIWQVPLPSAADIPSTQQADTEPAAVEEDSSRALALGIFGVAVLAAGGLVFFHMRRRG